MLQQGQARAALACFDVSLDHDPHNPQVWWHKGIAVEKCGTAVFSSLDQSALLRWVAQCYEEALRLAPELISVKLNLADVYNRCNYFEEMAKLLQEVVDHSLKQEISDLPISIAQIYELLVQAYEFAGGYELAAEAAEQAKRRGIESDELSRRQKALAGFVRNESIVVVHDLTLGPLTGPFQEADELQDVGLIDEMQVLLNDLVLQHGPLAVAASAARLAERQERSRKAKPEVKPVAIPAEKRVDTSSDVIVAWARTAIEEEQPDWANMLLHPFHEALPSCERAVSENPQDPTSWENFARCLLYMGRQDEALAVCRKGIKSIKEPHRGLSLLYAQLEAIENPSKALGLLYWLERDFSSQSSPDREIMLLQASCLSQVGRNSEAKNLLQRLQPNRLGIRLIEEYHWLPLFRLQGDPLLNLASLPWFPENEIPAFLCDEDIASHITDSSINTICDYLSSWLSWLSPKMPGADSRELLNGLLFGNKDTWSNRFLAIRAIGKVNYLAARLYAQPGTFAYAAWILAHIYQRAGMKHVALALFVKAIDAARQEMEPEPLVQKLLVDSYLQTAEIYKGWNQPGKAWREISALLPQAEQVPPDLCGKLWLFAGEVLDSLNRIEEATPFYQRIIDMPESANLPPPHTLVSDSGGSLFTSLHDYVALTLGGRKLIYSQKSVAYTAAGSGFIEREPISIKLDLPQGSTRFVFSAYHELFDMLQRQAAPLILVRNSIVQQQEGTNFLQSWSSLLEALVDTGLRVALPHRALEWLEVFKATTLVQRLGLQVGPCPEGISSDEWARLRELVCNYRLIVESKLDETTRGEARTNLSASQLEAAIRKLISSMRLKHPGIPRNLGMFDLHQGLPPASALQRLPTGSCILEFFSGAARGGCWLISPEDPKHPLWVELPGLMRRTVGQVAEELTRALTEWKETRIRDARKRLDKAISDALVFVREAVLRPLETQSAYQAAKHFVVIPHGAIHALPFHAAIDPDHATVSYAPSLTVLAQLREVPQRTHTRTLLAADSLPDCPGKLCSRPPHQCWRLPGARIERNVLEKLFSRHSYEVIAADGQDVTVGWLESQLPGTDIVHISTHAFFEAARPSNSGLLLAKGGSSDDAEGLLHLSHGGSLTDTMEDAVAVLWTLRRVLQRADLSQCRLLFLAGCETSLVHWEDMVDEFLGLPGGFLQSGAVTVIGSMWDVGDLPALLCTSQFYRNLLEHGYRPSQALAKAQEWLRTLTVRKMLEESAELLLDYYQLRKNELVDSAEDALRRFLGAIPPLDVPLFRSPFFWAAFRCIGLP